MLRLRLQARLLDSPGVVDSLPEAGHVRLVLDSADATANALPGISLTPVPPRFDVKNGRNTRSRSAAGMPGPLSFTEILETRCRRSTSD